MDKFENDLRRQLRGIELQLDDTTTRRLRQARSTALTRGRRSFLPRLVVPALGMVTASVVALVLVISPFDYPDGQEMMSPDNASFYQELDFYYWLAESNAARKS